MLNTESEKKNNNKCALMHFYITERLSHPSFLYILQFCDLKKHNMSKHVQYIRQKTEFTILISLKVNSWYDYLYFSTQPELC